MASKWNKKVPFRQKEDGNIEMLEWTGMKYPETRDPLKPPSWWLGEPDLWVDASEPFYAKLVVDGHWKGRSAVRIGLRDVQTGTKYSTGFYTFMGLIPHLVDSCISGKWRLKKQGSNYMIVPAEGD